MNDKLLQIDLTRSYEGYFWMSNNPTPMVFTKDKPLGIYLQEYGQPMTQLVYQENPFIVEGLLFDASDRLSCAIKFVDGQYLIHQEKVDPSALSTSVKSYLAQRMPEVEKLKFLQQWIEEKDPLCENMPVLKPARLVFIGFKLSGKNNHYDTRTL